MEREVFSAGKYFDEWGIIYNNLRTYSAYTKEDCHFITIDKVDFDKVWTKHIIKSDNEKRSFITEKLPHIAKMRKFDQFYKQMSLMVDFIFILKFKFIEIKNY